MSTKNSSDTIGNRTRDPPACKAVLNQLRCRLPLKGKTIPLQVWQALRFPGKLRLPDFNARGTWRLSALHTGRLYPQEMVLVLISDRGWISPMAIVRPEGLCQWKITMTPSGIEPVMEYQLKDWRIRIRSSMNFIFDRASNLYLCLYNQLFAIFHCVFTALKL